jgi:hypothetical protein
MRKLNKRLEQERSDAETKAENIDQFQGKISYLEAELTELRSRAVQEDEKVKDLHTKLASRDEELQALKNHLTEYQQKELSPLNESHQVQQELQNTKSAYETLKN